MDCRKTSSWSLIGAALLFVGAALTTASANGPSRYTPLEELGRFLYFDTNLSEPAGQACASCHLPDTAFVDPDAEIPVSEGVIPGLFGGRNTPSAAYAMYAPVLHFDDAEGLWIGGQFWDGRATGAVLGDPLADQALGPFLNPVEMHNPSKAHVITDVATADYADLFKQVWGEKSLLNVEAAYKQVALSIAAFERSRLFGSFSSKYDAYLDACLHRGGAPDDCAKGIGRAAKVAGKKLFSNTEWYGFQLFMNENNNNDGIHDPGEGAMCVACHVADWTPAAANVVVPDWAPKGMVPPMFTDFTFDNLGVPKNIEYPLDPDAPVDLGLGAIVGDPEENGKVKVMMLRNIELTAPYTHKGFFKSLKALTHFYNTRDVPGALPGGENWAPAEYAATMNNSELGSLGLNDQDEDALVAFMKTLTDGYMPRHTYGYSSHRH